MEYLNFDGETCIAEGGAEFSLETIIHPEDDYRSRFYPDGELVFKNKFKCVAHSRSDLQKSEKNIVPSPPPAVPKGYLKWILSYIDKIHDLLKDNYYFDHHGDLDSDISESSILSFIDSPDAISVTRLLYTFDLVLGFRHRPITQRDYYGINVSCGNSFIHHGMDFVDVDESVTFGRKTYNPSKSFKSLMTSRIYKDTDVIITIPVGEEMVSTGINGKNIIIESGAKFEGTIVRFYKSGTFWANQADFEFYPTIKGEVPYYIIEAPIFTMTLQMAKGVEGMMSRQSYGPDAFYYGAQYKINAFIPLHWISHVKKGAEYFEITDNPIPQPCSYDPMQGLMPMIEFMKSFSQ